jgi:hypothetical protein
MTHPINGDTPEAPLDPTLERVQARLRRLMLIAGLTLGVGMFAVFAAILYRIAIMDSSGDVVAFAPGDPIPTIQRSLVGVPEDARLVSVAADGGRVILVYTHGDGESLVFVDAASLSVTSRLDISAD